MKTMTFKILDRTGDTRQSFDMADATAVESAMGRFAELTKQGYRAAKLTKTGEPGELMRAFDPTAEDVLFIPALQGG